MSQKTTPVDSTFFKQLILLSKLTYNALDVNIMIVGHFVFILSFFLNKKNRHVAIRMNYNIFSAFLYKFSI